MCTEDDMKKIASAVIEEYCDQLTDEVVLSVRGLIYYLQSDNLAVIDYPGSFQSRVSFITAKAHRIDGARTLGRMIIESIEDHADEGLVHAGDALRKIEIEEGQR